jgi:hypothetical protein
MLSYAFAIMITFMKKARKREKHTDYDLKSFEVETLGKFGEEVKLFLRSMCVNFCFIHFIFSLTLKNRWFSKPANAL